MIPDQTDSCYWLLRSIQIKVYQRTRRYEEARDGAWALLDNLLGIKVAALGRVAHIDQPLIFYRIHAGSLSCSSDSVEAYTSAQTDVVQEFDRLVKEHVHPEEHGRLKFHPFEWFVRDLAAVWGRSRQNLHPWQIWGFIRVIRASYISKLPLKHKLRLTMTITRLVFVLLRKSVHEFVASHAQ